MPCALTPASAEESPEAEQHCSFCPQLCCGHTNEIPRFETLMENQHLKNSNLKNSNHTMPIFMYSGNKLHWFFISVGHRQKLNRNQHHRQDCQKGREPCQGSEYLISKEYLISTSSSLQPKGTPGSSAGCWCTQ